ncbi:MAG: L,D-transpeptidase [Chloroflexi bacterium]|nr:L,D-transpeptidase [Chloroflexota bacterium]
MVQHKLSRRALLRAGLVAGTASLLGSPRLFSSHLVHAQDDAPFDPGGRVRIDYDETQSWNEYYDNPPLLGRVEVWAMSYHSEPDVASSVAGRVTYGQVLPIYESLRAAAPPALPHNDIWYNIGDGYVHSSFVVPCREIYHEPYDQVTESFWGEITVPTSWQHWEPKLRSTRYYDLAYGAVFLVIDRAEEEDGLVWYQLRDDLRPEAVWWVQASHVRPIADEEFSPLSPDVDPEEKVIEVNLGEQIITCIESGVPVFQTRIASGTHFYDGEGRLIQFYTPRGSHFVLRKTPSRHMVGGEDINDLFDLPGVPWCTFLTPSGVAIHGTYWHNDYGHPRSHGCINVTNDAAKWIYRWNLPDVGLKNFHFTTRTEQAIATTINIF